MKVLKSASYPYRYFVHGKGFVASSPSEATQIADAEAAQQQECLQGAGLGASTVENAPGDPNIKQNSDGSSWAVFYVRKNQIRSDGSVIAHKNNPSKRRFATEAEAIHHASRFVKIEGHVGFWTQKRYEPVNAYVNQVTGKTNPEVGKKRTNR